MAWHPFLPPETFEAIAKQRTKFLRRFAEKAPELLSTLAPSEQHRPSPEIPPRAENAIRTATAAALTDAAEIAFLSNRTSEGREFVNICLNILLAQPVPLWPAPRVALLGAVSRQVATELHRDEFLLRADKTSLSGTWQAEAGIADHTAGALLAAALASGDGPGRLEVLAANTPHPDHAATLGFITLLKSPQAQLLPLFGFARDENGRIGHLEFDNNQLELGWNGAIARVQGYAERVWTLRMDQIGWEQLRHQAPLLDWTLLTLFLGLRRSRGPGALDELVRRCGQSGLVPVLATYLRDLANEIDGEADQGADRPLFPVDPLIDYAAQPQYREMS